MPIVLGCAGLIPFLLSVLFYAMQRPLLGLSADFVFLSYSVAILNFMAGAIWGRSLSLTDDKLSYRGFLFSNLCALMAWFALLISWVTPVGGLAILGMTYLLVLLWDYSFFNVVYAGVSPSYRTLRIGLTAVVVTAHGVMIGIEWQY